MQGYRFAAGHSWKNGAWSSHPRACRSAASHLYARLVVGLDCPVRGMVVCMAGIWNRVRFGSADVVSAGSDQLAG